MLKSQVWFLLALGFVSGTVPNVFAQGGLLITPTRLTFEDRSRTATLTLVNRGDTSMTYRLFFTEKRMDERGALVDLPPDQPGRFASHMVRFSPRRVTLAPGQTQKVRLQWRPPPDLEPGEYRSHLVFQVAPRDSGFSLAHTGGGDGKVGIRLTPVFGAAIPIIARRGNPEAAIRISEAGFTPGTKGENPMLWLFFERTGTRSVYGNVSIQWVPEEGEPRQVGFVKGMAVYPDVAGRRLEIPIAWPQSPRGDGGHLDIQYRSGEDPDSILATYRLTVPR